MLFAGEARYPGDGWETARRREPGNEWAIIRLAGRGTVKKLIVDLRGFGGTTPEGCSVDGIDAPGAHPDDLLLSEWSPILPQTALEGDRRHEVSEISEPGPYTHLRLGLHPDGGVARFRAIGKAEEPWV
jgi:allantoicase